VLADRVTVWTDRLRDADPEQRTILAEDGGALIGFAHVALDDDPRWGALLDNLHVVHGHKRRGVGSRLLALTARLAVDRGTGLYLWVLEQNVEAQAFYEAHGARRVELTPTSPPGGVEGRLSGSPSKLRYAWADPAAVSA
jgi:GNAT superfamily N-acetyltransferase